MSIVSPAMDRALSQLLATAIKPDCDADTKLQPDTGTILAVRIVRGEL